MNGRWTGRRAARTSRIPERVDPGYAIDPGSSLDDPGGGDREIGLEAIPEGLRGRLAVGALIAATISFTAGWSFGRHGRSRSRK